MILLNILGGVALILFGVRFLRKGLERLTSRRLHQWLARTASSSTRVLLTGAAFGTVAPSSTAQTLTALQLCESAGLPGSQVLLFLLGSGIGITITVQLISLDFTRWYPVLIAAGVAGFQFFRANIVRGVGQIVLSLGFIFLAMELIGRGGTELAAVADFQEILRIGSTHPALIAVLFTVVAFAMQSSTATIGLALSLAQSGAVGAPVLAAAVLGTNLGLALTAVAAGWPTPDGRRLGLANLILKGSGFLAGLIAFEPLLRLMARLPGPLSRQTANLHTAFNVVVALAGWLFARALWRLMLRLVAPVRATDPVRPLSSALDVQALDTPSLALANASRETLLLAGEVKAMLEGSWRALVGRQPALARQVQLHDDRVDELNRCIKRYLSRIPGEVMNPTDQELQFGLLNFASQLEAIADLVGRGFCYQVLKHLDRGEPFSTSDEADLAEIYARVLRRFDLAISVLASRDEQLARKFLDEGEALKDWTVSAQKRHYQRLNSHNEPELIESADFLDLLNSLRRISGLLSTIGHTFLPETRGRAPSSVAGA